MISIRGPLGDKRSRELLASNFPARIAVQVELWQSGRWFDDILFATAWVHVVQIDPLTNAYDVRRVEGDSLVLAATYPTIDALVVALAEPRTARIAAPPGLQRLYYAVNVSIESLTSNDLAELQRYLSGDVRPTLEGRKNPLAMLARGVRTVFSRLLGGDTKRFSVVSETFGT